MGSIGPRSACRNGSLMARAWARPAPRNPRVIRRHTIDKSINKAPSDTPAETSTHAWKRCDSRHTGPRGGAANGMDENERITLRLERDNLELIDRFLADNPGYKNPSQLCPDAGQSFIEAVTPGGNTVQFRVPR